MNEKKTFLLLSLKYFINCHWNSARSREFHSFFVSCLNLDIFILFLVFFFLELIQKRIDAVMDGGLAFPYFVFAMPFFLYTKKFSLWVSAAVCARSWWILMSTRDGSRAKEWWTRFLGRCRMNGFGETTIGLDVMQSNFPNSINARSSSTRK